MSEYMVAEFKGTYRAPHPEGIRDQNILRPFHCKVKMPIRFLEAPGLQGLFVNHYAGRMKRLYPLMIKPYQFEFLGARNPDGSPIRDPKAMYYEELLQYIKDKRYPINHSLYSALELRDEIALYEADKKGQQHLQGKREVLRGGTIALAAELDAIDDLIEMVEPDVVEPRGADAPVDANFAELMS